MKPLSIVNIRLLVLLGLSSMLLGAISTGYAQAMLRLIPEAREEMKVCVWWQTQNRSDLVEHASVPVSELNR